MDMFKNRTEAGQRLLQKLRIVLAAKNAALANVVVALPRGGVPVAVEIAREIKAPLTVLVSKKISAPFQPEYAIGAVSSSGLFVLSDEPIGLPANVVSEHINSERKRLSALTQEMELKWLKSAGLTEQLDFHAKRAIVVDDGIATGMTVMAAADSLKQLGAAEILIATPVLAADSRLSLQRHCDEIVAVLEPFDMGAIGMFYEDFHQVPDDEVREALSSCVNG